MLKNENGNGLTVDISKWLHTCLQQMIGEQMIAMTADEIRTLIDQLRFGCPMRASADSVLGEKDPEAYERFGLKAADVLERLADTLDDQEANQSMTDGDLRGLSSVLWNKAQDVIYARYNISPKLPLKNTEELRAEFLKMVLNLTKIQ